MEVKIPEEPFFASAEPLIDAIERLYDGFKEGKGSAGQLTGEPFELLGDRVAAAQRQVESINDKASKLRKNGLAFAAVQEEASQRRTTERLKALRVEIEAHNRACDELLDESERVKMNVLHPWLARFAT